MSLSNVSKDIVVAGMLTVQGHGQVFVEPKKEIKSEFEDIKTEVEDNSFLSSEVQVQDNFPLSGCDKFSPHIELIIKEESDFNLQDQVEIQNDDVSQSVTFDCYIDPSVENNEKVNKAVQFENNTKDVQPTDDNAIAQKSRNKDDIKKATKISQYIQDSIKQAQEVDPLQLGPDTESLKARSEELLQTEDRSLKCPHCIGFNGETFANEANLNLHISKEHPYLCPICTKTLVENPYQIQLHFKLHHRNVTPYLCGNCPRVFASKSVAEIHLKYAHAGTFDRKLKSILLQCPICPDMLLNENDFRSHIKQAHDVHQSRCLFCNLVSFIQQEINLPLSFKPRNSQNYLVMFYSSIKRRP